MQDLGGLGAREGPPVAYHWTLPSLMPLALPWIGLLALLALKPNRQPHAWWVCMPLALTAGLSLCLRPVFEFVPSEPLDLFCESFSALAFGIAAVWLLSFWLEGKPRIVGFLGVLLILGGGSLLALVAKQDMSDFWWVPGVIVLGFCVGALSVGLSLAGLACRRRYGPVKLSLWLMAWIAAAWIVLTAPFFLLAMASTGGSLKDQLGFVAAIFGFAAATFVTVLPFLILSFANPFFRDRLKGLLRLPAGAATAPLPAATQPPAAR